MQAFIDEPDYTILESSDTYTTTVAYIYPYFKIVWDPDGDSIDDNLELQLAGKFKPVLHEHSYDQRCDTMGSHRSDSGIWSLIIGAKC